MRRIRRLVVATVAALTLTGIVALPASATTCVETEVGGQPYFVCVG